MEDLMTDDVLHLWESVTFWCTRRGFTPLEC